MRATMSSSPPRSYFDALPIDMHGHRKKLQFFLAALERFRLERGLQASEMRILEVGCSNGRNVALPLAEQGYTVTGLDIHEPSIHAATAARGTRNARFVATDLSVFRSEHLHDVLILSDVLEHVEDPQQMIARGLEHLSPGGMVLMSIPNGYGPFEIERSLLNVGVLRPVLLMRDGLRWLRRRVRGDRRQPAPELPAYNWESGHVQFFTDRSFRQVLDAARLRIRTKANGCLFGGEVTSYLHTYVPGLTKTSLQLADYLPSPLVSTWYFECDRMSDESGG